MNFLELRERLTELAKDPRHSKADPEAVWCDRHDRGRTADNENRWHLREQDGQFEVSWLERGRFVFTEVFESEAAACEWLLDTLQAVPPPTASLPESEIHQRIEAMRLRYAAQGIDLGRGESREQQPTEVERAP